MHFVAGALWEVTTTRRSGIHRWVQHRVGAARLYRRGWILRQPHHPSHVWRVLRQGHEFNRYVSGLRHYLLAMMKQQTAPGCRCPEKIIRGNWDTSSYTTMSCVYVLPWHFHLELLVLNNHLDRRRTFPISSLKLARSDLLICLMEIA